MEQIKEITLEEAEKILSKDIAYITMKDGEVIIVNGLDHDKFNKKLKEYESNNYTEEQNLQLIKEDTEENERNSKLYNQQNISYNNKEQIKCSCRKIRENNKFPRFNNSSYIEIKSTTNKKNEIIFLF